MAISHFGLLVLATLIILSAASCDTYPEIDVSDDPAYMRGMTIGQTYSLVSDVFFREYKNVLSLEPPNSLRAPFTLSAFHSGQVNDAYVQAIISAGTMIRLERVVVRNYQTHTTPLCTARIMGGPMRGKRVLINALLDEDVDQFLKKTTVK